MTNTCPTLTAAHEVKQFGSKGILNKLEATYFLGYPFKDPMLLTYKFKRFLGCSTIENILS